MRHIFVFLCSFGSDAIGFFSAASSVVVVVVVILGTDVEIGLFSNLSTNHATDSKAQGSSKGVPIHMT